MSTKLHGYLIVSGAIKPIEARAFQSFVQQCANQDSDSIHPIDPIGSLDLERVDVYVSQHIANKVGVLVGVCSDSLQRGTRIQQVECRTVEIAKQLKKKVAVIVVESDHLVASAVSEYSSEVDTVILHDIMCTLSPEPWKLKAQALFPNATIIVPNSTAYSGYSTRSAMDKAHATSA